MKMYPVQWEIYSEDLSYLIAEFKAIDENAITVNVKSNAVSPEDLTELSKHLEEAYKQYTEPDKEN